MIPIDGWYKFTGAWQRRPHLVRIAQYKDDGRVDVESIYPMKILFKNVKMSALVEITNPEEDEVFRWALEKMKQ